MNALSTELKVGAFAIIVLILLALMTFKVGGLEFAKRKGYTLYIFFRNTDGLDEKSKVKVAGVDAGSVEGIHLVDGKARVTLRINPHIDIYRDATAAIKSAGLLGDKYIEIGVGTSGSGLMKDGDAIQSVTEVVDVDDLARKLVSVSENFTKLAGTLNDVLGSDEAKSSLNRTIMNLNSITASLKGSIDVNDYKLRRVLDNIDSLTASLNGLVARNSQQLSESMSNIKDLSAALKAQGPELVENLNRTARELQTMIDENRPAMKNTMQSLDNITKKVDSGQGSLGKLINDDHLYSSLDKTAEGVSKTLAAVDSFRTIISLQGEYLTKPSSGKGYFYVTLQPNEDKSYILGVVGTPVETVTTTHTTTTPPGTTVQTEEMQKKIRFTAQFAPRIGNGDVRIGVTENTLGFGGDYYLFKKRLKVSADVWDFSKDEEGARNPHVKAGADYFLFRSLFISAGFDNIFNSRMSGAYFGGGVRFADDDWKHFFSAPAEK